MGVGGAAEGIDGDGHAGSASLLSVRHPLILAWSGFVLVAAAYFGAHALPLPFRASLVINQFAFLMPMLLSVAGSWVAYRRAQGTERLFWLLLALANGLLLVSETYYSAWMFLVDVKGPASPSAFDALNLAAAVLFLVLLLSMTHLATMSAAVRVRVLMDIAGGFVIAVAVGYAIVSPLFDRYGITNPATRVLGAVYPVVGLVMLTGTLSNIVGLKASKWQPWERMVAMSLAVFSVGGLMLWPIAVVSTTPGSTSPIFDLAYLASEYTLFMATVSRIVTPGESRLRPLPPPLAISRARRGATAALVPLVLLASAVAFAVHAKASSGDVYGRVMTTGAAVTLGVVLVARTALTTIENGSLFHRSVTDALTGVYNHRYFHERLAAELDMAGRYGDDLAVAVMDLDDFSRVNNVQGHLVGDSLLAEVAVRLTAASRTSDAVCRIGGDEFAVILPETPAEDAAAVCDRLLVALRHDWAPLGTPVTASIGLACFPNDSGDKEELLRKADGAQYWAKYHGKNQVVRYDARVVESLDAEERIRRLEESSHLATVRALAAAVDARDPLTQHHSRNVARLAVALAAELELDVEKARLIEIAALLHDIGKIGISDDVLKKQACLTAEERSHIEEHPVLGDRILSSTNLREILPWALGHHERWDGGGYPFGLAGEDIPLEARILAVCDAFDSMTSDRPYRQAMSTIEALHEIDLCAGTQFDAALAVMFISMMKRTGAQGAAEAS